MKPIIPPAKFTTALDALDEAPTTRDVPVADLVVLDKLNLRVEGTDDHAEGIAELARKIEANGFYPDKPLAGYVRQDGKVVVTDGHRRLAAVRSLNENSLDGDVVPTLPVVVSPGSIDDVTIKMIASSEGRELSMFEKGIGVRRLLANGISKDDIAARLGVHVKTIENYLTVASVPPKARDLLLDGRVTSTQVLRAKGDADKLSAMVDKAKAAGRTRARPSDAKTEDAVRETGAELKAAIANTPSPTDSFDMTLAKGSTLGAVLRDIAAAVRARVPHDQGDEDTTLVNGMVTVSVTLTQPEKPRRQRKAAEEAIPAELAHAIEL